MAEVLPIPISPNSSALPGKLLNQVHAVLQRGFAFALCVMAGLWVESAAPRRPCAPLQPSRAASGQADLESRCIAAVHHRHARSRADAPTR